VAFSNLTNRPQFQENYCQTQGLNLKGENMKLKINGEDKTISASHPTIMELLTLEKVKMPEYVSVQVNGVFAKSANYGIDRIAENDEVDFLYFMGGGQQRSIEWNMP
jgi:sulfur carrier protein